MSMNGLKSFLFWLVIVVIIAGGGYWAFTTIESGRELARRDEILPEPEEEIDLDTLADLGKVGTDGEQLPESPSEDEESPGAKEPSVSPEVKSLRADLQDLLDREAILEPGDSGLFVLRIQKFLNYYDQDLNLTEDQDFGPSTRAAVEAFQKEAGLNPDGGVGPKTLQAMIDFLD